MFQLTDDPQDLYKIFDGINFDRHQVGDPRLDTPQHQLSFWKKYCENNKLLNKKVSPYIVLWDNTMSILGVHDTVKDSKTLKALEYNGSLAYSQPKNFIYKNPYAYFVTAIDSKKIEVTINFNPYHPKQVLYLLGLFDLANCFNDPGSIATKEDFPEFERRLEQLKQLLPATKFGPKVEDKINGWIIKLDALRRHTLDRLKREEQV